MRSVTIAIGESKFHVIRNMKGPRFDIDVRYLILGTQGSALDKLESCCRRRASIRRNYSPAGAAFIHPRSQSSLRAELDGTSCRITISAPWVRRAGPKTRVSVQLTIRANYQWCSCWCHLLGAYRWWWRTGSAKSYAQVERSLAVIRTRGLHDLVFWDGREVGGKTGWD
jgi:hypothetical protein